MIGFNIKKDDNRYERGSKILVAKDLVCDKQGKICHSKRSRGLLSPVCDEMGNLQDKLSKKHRRSVKRCGCEAMIRFTLDKSSSMWVVTTFVEEHNHDLVDVAHLCYLKCNSSLDETKKEMLSSMSQANIHVSRQIALIASESGGYENMTFTSRQAHGHISSKRKELAKYDVEMVLDCFSSFKAIDPKFFYSYQKDPNCCLTHLFWTDPVSVEDCGLFGDAIVFDTTYCTNKYSMVFGMFGGVDHHRKTVLFASDLLVDEKYDSFVWIFKQYLLCFGKEPISIITDQDPSMNVAIISIFPNCKHRFCSWHILQKLPSKLGGIPNKDQIISLLNDCVWNVDDVDIFEERWDSIIQEHDLLSSTWLFDMYAMRCDWVPCYMQSSFAGMRMTQRRESLNAFIRSHVNSRKTLFELVCSLETAYSHVREIENFKDFDDEYSNLPLSSLWPLEEQMRGIYTKSIFKIFQSEVHQSMVYNVKQASEGVFEVYRVGGLGTPRILKKELSSDIISCSCFMLEFKGIPYRHILSYLKSRDYCTLLEPYILKRWTKGYREHPLIFGKASVKHPSTGRTLHLVFSCNSIVNIAFRNNVVDLCHEKLLALRKELLDLDLADPGAGAGATASNTTSSSAVKVHIPSSCKTKGRPRSTDVRFEV